MKSFAGLLVLLSGIALAPAHAQVYKCKEANGSILYTNMRCGRDAVTITVIPKYAFISVIPMPGIYRMRQAAPACVCCPSLGSGYPPGGLRPGSARRVPPGGIRGLAPDSIEVLPPEGIRQPAY